MNAKCTRGRYTSSVRSIFGVVVYPYCAVHACCPRCSVAWDGIILRILQRLGQQTFSEGKKTTQFHQEISSPSPVEAEEMIYVFYRARLAQKEGPRDKVGINDKRAKKKRRAVADEKICHWGALRFIRFRTTRVTWPVNKGTPIFRGSVLLPLSPDCSTAL